VTQPDYDDHVPNVTNYDRNAELAVLACCLMSVTARNEAKKHLVGGDFYHPAHEIIWDAMSHLDRSGGGVDPAGVLSHVQDVVAKQLLPTLLTYPVVADNVGEFSRIVRSWGTKRRLYAEGARVQQMALSPILDAETVAAKCATAFAQLRDSGITEDIQSVTLAELLDEADDEPDWLIPGLLERRDRLMLTGEEGLGKSYLLRQFAIMAAAGIDPFDPSKRITPIRCMVIDCENDKGKVRRKVRPVVQFAKRYGHPNGNADIVTLLCSPRIDITRDRDLARIHRELDATRPDLLVIGPLYRLTGRAIQTDDEAAPLLAALDTIRDRGIALLIEAHAGHAIGKGNVRDLRPRGSSALLGWPEFGYGMRAVASDYADLVPWRGDRDAREFPQRVKIASDRIRWIPVDADVLPQEWA